MDIITANSLGDGRVVFQTPTGWSRDIDAAELLHGKDAVEIAMVRANAAAATNRVVEPYAIEVARDGSQLTPLRLRERIRTAGPTTGNSLPKGGAAADPAA